MNNVNKPFDIVLRLDIGANEETFRVNHSSETFDFALNGKQISIINNGDNSWSEVGNTLDQETVNYIGQQIEDRFKELPL